MKKSLVALSLAALVALAGCSSPAAQAPAVKPAAPAASAPAQPAQAPVEQVAAAIGLSGLTGEQIVEKLDKRPEAGRLDLRASVRYDYVLIGDGKVEAKVPITNDKFYVSIAPYASQTHDCHFHSLSTCQGEMAGTKVHVTIADQAGTKLVDEDATTYANGFAGFWIPRDTTGTVTVTVDGKTGTVPFSSHAGEATCITTLKVT